MRACLVAVYATIYLDLTAGAGATLVPKWGRHTLQGWWNPHSSGPQPVTTIKGYDYIVVGSGPGGAPLAARLGLAGHRVLVIEAGADEAATDINATVPLLNAKASEDEKLSWSFYVDHYPDRARNARDYKYNYQLPNGSLYYGLSPPADATPKGIFYPRTAALGGCVNHNALIMMYPLDTDWTEIANLTGDDSWNAGRMRTYFEKLEQCQYLPRNTQGHGFDGWLPTNRADPSIFLSDSKVYWMLKAAASLTGQVIGSVSELLTLLSRDLNTGSIEYASEHGVYNAPLNMDRYKRSSPRDFLLATQQAVNSGGSGGHIDIRLNCLVTRVIFAPGTKQAIGVEFLDGASLYRADPRNSNGTGTPGVAFTRKEVILAGGAYNTPQLLMLSGVGAPTELDRYNIPQIIRLPGVGQNLQDRIENSVVSNASTPWTVFKGCTLGVNSSDPCLQQWYAEQSNKTNYATNGRPAHIPMRSTVAPNPFNDLVITGRPGYFAGYFAGYATIGGKYPNSWTWPVLKAHTQNRAGVVSLKSDDPRDVPYINFNFFDAGSGDWNYDLAATVEGMQFARKVFAEFSELTNTTMNELIPGPAYQTEDDLREWVRYNSWGHHASCSCPIGTDDDPMAVLDGQFRVRGAKGLRVVDASVFPQIPGFYIQTSIYMISEKAADVIRADAGIIKPY